MFEVPAVLEEMQHWFAGHLTRTFRETGDFNLPIYSDSHIREIRERIAPSPTLKAEQRFAIYNQQYWWRLFVLLQESYPTLVRLFGFRDFNTLIAEPYLLRYPPTHWFLPDLGIHLVQWMEEDYREEDRPLLLQAASVDSAYERLSHAGTDPTISPDTEIFFLQPYIALFALNADFFSFRASLLKHDVAYWQTHDLPELDNAKRTYFSVLYRTKEGLFHEELQREQYLLLSAFQNGSSLADACAPLDSSCADFIASWFQAWVQRSFFCVREEVYARNREP